MYVKLSKYTHMQTSLRKEPHWSCSVIFSNVKDSAWPITATQ